MRMSDQTMHDALQALRAKDWPTAIDLLQAMIDAGSAEAGTYVSLARALRHVGSYEKAEAALKRAEALDPDGERAKKERELLARKRSKVDLKAPGNVYHGSTAATYQARREHSVRWRRENEAVETYLAALPRGLSVIDIPFGTGRFTPYYVACGMAITGVDVSGDMLESARGIYDLAEAKLEIGDATALAYPDKHFDLVVSVRFLQNIIPYALVRRALAEMARVTRSWAILELEIRKPMAIDAGRPAEDQPIRGLLFRKQIDEMLSTAGFSVEQITKIYDNETSDYCMILCQVVSKAYKWP